jgi:8-oxo-dGTP pyrophosphatase MutT (NUDIX family)
MTWFKTRPHAPRKTEGEGTPAAVLVPLVLRPEGVTVLLTQRTAHLAHHPGQISFPGGRFEEADGGDAIVCALRETQEEIGLAHNRVTVLGCLPERPSRTGFRVTPVIGLVEPPFDLALDDFEVAEAFEVPMEFLLDAGNRHLQRATHEGRERSFWSIPWEGRNIWGLTAAILVSLADELATCAVAR